MKYACQDRLGQVVTAILNYSSYFHHRFFYVKNPLSSHIAATSKLFDILRLFLTIKKVKVLENFKDTLYCGFGPFCSTGTKVLLSISLLMEIICIIYQFKKTNNKAIL